jgi:hypothetical protein
MMMMRSERILKKEFIYRDDVCLSVCLSETYLFIYGIFNDAVSS